MITTVTLNPAIDREYFVNRHVPEEHKYIYDEQDIRVYPGGKGLLTAINLRNLGYQDVQNMGFVGGRQGLFFEKMVQEYKVTTNYVYTDREMRNNVHIIGKHPVSYTHYNDYSYMVDSQDVEELLKRFKRGITESDMVIIAGSIPGGVDFSIYQKLISICNMQNKDVILEASGEALNLALQCKPKIVIPYFKHTNKILDEQVIEFDDYIRMGRKLLEYGAGHVILPFYNDHLLFLGEKAYTLSMKDFHLVNWLGAGDAFNAAFYDHVFSNGFDFLDAVKYAGAAYLAVAESRSIFLQSRSEIEDNLKRIVIKELEV